MVRRALIAPFVLAAVVATAERGVAQGAGSAAAHLDNILAAHGSTPDGAALLDVAISDATVANEHAGLASGDPTNIDPMIRHARHVLHALDPAEFAQGPGSGFGLRPAVRTMQEELALAMAAPDASAETRAAGQRVAALLEAMAASIDDAVAEARGVIGAPEYMAASSRVERLQEVCSELPADLEEVRVALASLAP